MRKLSLWARHHRWKARIVIITSQILLAWLAYITGNGLRNLNIIVPGPLLYILLLLFMVIAFAYPHRSKEKDGKRYSFTYRKTLDSLAALCSFCILCCANNRQEIFFPGLQATNNSVSPEKKSGPTAQEILASLSHRDKSTLTRSEKKVLKKEFRSELKKYVNAKIRKDPTRADQALLIILAIIVALGLLYLVAAAACSLSCSGADAAAALVAIVGTVGIIWLLVIIIKNIVRRKGPDPVPAPPAGTAFAFPAMPVLIN